MRALAAILFWVFSVVAAVAGGRVALVIGNNAYGSLTPLANPALDARRLADMLKVSGFDVLSCDGRNAGCFDLERADFNDTLELFQRKARGADVAFVFYAGHGMQTGKGNVLAPVDMEIDCDADDPYRAVMLDQVLEAVAGAKEKIVIIDACRNDPLAAKQCAQRGARALSFGSFAVSQGETKFLLMASTLPGQTAPDGLPGGHSPFAEALFHWIEEAPGIEIGQLLDRVAIRVEERARAQSFIQVPEILIRGGAPKFCLKADGCGSDPEAAALRKEVETLKKSNARASEYEEIVVAMLREAGYESLDALPVDERKRFFEGIVGASRALAERRDEKGEQALVALKRGDEAKAEALFAEELAAIKGKTAEQNKEAAEAARHIAALAHPKDVAKAARYYAEAAALDPDDIQTWMDLGAAAESSGNSAEALRAFREASKRSRDAGSDSQRVWAAFREADIEHARGKPERALKLYQIAAGLAAERARKTPDDIDARRDVSIALERIGDVYISQNNLSAALGTFNESLGIRRSLAENDPGNPVAARDIAVMLNRIGDVGRSQNDLARAEASYGEAADIFRRLAQAEPGDNGRARDLNVSLNRIGDVQRLRNELDSAVATYEEGLAIARQLVAADPNNAQWANDLTVSLDRMGDVMALSGNSDGAIASYEEALSIARRLSAADPENGDSARSVSVGLNKIGDMRMDRQEREAALAAYREGLDIARRVAEADPSFGERARDLSVSLERVGTVLRETGDLDGAADAFEEALSIRRRLSQEDPTHGERARDVSVSLNKVGDIRLERDDQAGAVAAYDEGLAIAERLAAADPTHSERQRDLIISHFKLAEAGEDPRGHYQAALDVAETMQANGILAPADSWLPGFLRERLEALGASAVRQ